MSFEFDDNGKEKFTKDEIHSSIKAFLDYGEQSYNPSDSLEGHKGYFSGYGFAARALRYLYNNPNLIKE